MQWQSAAHDLSTTLDLAHPPVAMKRADGPLPGAEGLARPVTSACAIWRLGERELVYASRDDHANCPIGLLTMGFEPTPEMEQAAMLLVGNMAELGYLAAEEVAHLPMLPRDHAGMLYGPAAAFPVEPDVVLVITTPETAMLIAEGVGVASMKPDAGRPFFGRPACSVIPRAFSEGGAEFSLACKGARILAELAPGEMLVALPGNQLSAIASSVHAAIRANDAMATLYNEKKTTFA